MILTLDEESMADMDQTYANMDPAEKEQTLTIWWMVYNTDRSAACCEGSHFLINEDECVDVEYPCQPYVSDLQGTLSRDGWRRR